MLILDTNAWLAWTSWPSRITPKAVKAIIEEEKRQGIIISAISVWEVAVKSALGKLILDREVRQWVSFAASYPGFNLVPLDPADALESTQIPGDFHKDPADRILIAMARRMDCPIVTGDRAIRSYRYVKTLW